MRRPPSSGCSKCSATARPRPAAIVGIPVGFVGAAESKDALIEEAPRAFRHRSRPARRQRRHRRRGQRARPGRAIVSTPARLIGVGVGPGDPELMTLKAVRALREADVVAHFAKAGRAGNARAIAAAPHDRPARSSCRSATRSPPRSRPATRPTRRAIDAFFDAVRRDRRAASRRGAHRRRPLRGRSPFLRLLHAPPFPPEPPLPDRGDPRRHQPVRLLVGGRPAAGQGRRRALRRARHARRRTRSAPGSPVPTRSP